MHTTHGIEVCIDLLAKGNKDRYLLVDAKNGLRPRLTPNQKNPLGYRDIPLTGFTPIGERAREALLTPGVKIHPDQIIGVEIHYWLGTKLVRFRRMQ